MSMLRACSARYRIALRAFDSGHLIRKSHCPSTTPSHLSTNAIENFVSSPLSLPPFAQLHVEQLEPVMLRVIQQTRKNLQMFERKLSKLLESDANIKWEDVVYPYESQSDTLERVWGIVRHLMSVRNSNLLRSIHERLQKNVIQINNEISQSLPINKAFRAIAESTIVDMPRKRLVQQALLHAKLSGVALEGKAKDRFNELKSQNAELSVKFSSNVLDATKAYSLTVVDRTELSGLPDSLLQLYAKSARDAGDNEATADTGPWKITLDPPSYVEFMKYADNRSLRELLYRKYASRASHSPHDNNDIITKLLANRREMAKILEFESFAQLSLASKMASNVDKVEKMHQDLKQKCFPIAIQELKNLQDFAKKRGLEEALAPWDIAFYTEQLKAELFHFSDTEIKPYFPLEKVLQGLFSLSSDLFGINVKAADGEAEVWNEDVRFFRVFDNKDGSHIASFFLDPYSRLFEKNGGAWMNACVTRTALPSPSGGKTVRLPVAYLACNQTPPLKEGEDSLMTFREVETLFHEFGHGLQHMLTKMEYASIAGINGIEWDAVELPSQMMENFCYDRDILKSISGHYQTGEPLPDILFEKINSARTYMAATTMLRQLSFGDLDMYLHHQFPVNGEESVFDVQDRIFREYCCLPLLENDRFLCSFNHIFAGGYASGYYSYKWAEVLSCDAYEAFKDAKLSGEKHMISAVGEKYRATVLSMGGGCHPLDVFKSFRGREPSIDPLLTQYGLNK